MQRLNFLGRKIRLSREGWGTEGTVFYFCETALILEINPNNYEVVNIQNFDKFSIEVLGEQEGEIEACLNKEILTAA